MCVQAKFRDIPENKTRTSYDPWLTWHEIMVMGVVAAVVAIVCAVSMPTQPSEHTEDETLRILLVGKTGVGKSATGNTILGRKAFVSEVSSSSVTSQCMKVQGVVKGRRVAVIDSPGFYDTHLSAKEVVQRVKLCIPLSSPGPHVILAVIQLGRFTEEDQKTLMSIQAVFGQASATYTMALFTHGDRLGGKSLHRLILDNAQLQSFIQTCGGGYHMFNNHDKDPAQVTQLLDQIDKMVTKNGGKHYTSDMLAVAERAVEQLKRRILKENAEQRRKEEESLRAKWEGEVLEKNVKKLKEEHVRQAREQAEIDSWGVESLQKWIQLLIIIIENVQKVPKLLGL